MIFVSDKELMHFLYRYLENQIRKMPSALKFYRAPRRISCPGNEGKTISVRKKKGEIKVEQIISLVMEYVLVYSDRFHLQQVQSDIRANTAAAIQGEYNALCASWE